MGWSGDLLEARMNSSTAAVLVLLGAGGGFLLGRVCPPAQPERSEETVERLAVLEAENARLRMEAAAVREVTAGLQGAARPTTEPAAADRRPAPEAAPSGTPAAAGTEGKKAKG